MITRELIFLLLFTCNCVVSIKMGFLFLLVLGMGCIILLWHSLGLPYNYFTVRLISDRTTHPVVSNGNIHDDAREAKHYQDHTQSKEQAAAHREVNLLI